MTSSPDASLANWHIEREIVLSRIIKARRAVVFPAWTEPEHLPNWFGPAGFKIETKEIDIRVGGVWRFDILAPNGQRFTNRMRFRRIEPPHAPAWAMPPPNMRRRRCGCVDGRTVGAPTPAAAQGAPRGVEPIHLRAIGPARRSRPITIGELQR